MSGRAGGPASRLAGRQDARMHAYTHTRYTRRMACVEVTEVTRHLVWGRFGPNPASALVVPREELQGGP